MDKYQSNKPAIIHKYEYKNSYPNDRLCQLFVSFGNIEIMFELADSYGKILLC